MFMCTHEYISAGVRSRGSRGLHGQNEEPNRFHTEIRCTHRDDISFHLASKYFRILSNNRERTHWYIFCRFRYLKDVWRFIYYLSFLFVIIYFFVLYFIVNSLYLAIDALHSR